MFIIKILKLLLVLGFTVLLSSIVIAANATKLEITDLDVKVGSKTDKGLVNGDVIGREAKPGDTIKLDIQLTNQYTRDENIDIEDITVTVTIADIDDGDDLEKEASISKIRPDRDKTVSLNFEVPLKVEEGDYDVDIEVEGEDENGRDQSFSWSLTLTVDKEKHKLNIYKKALGEAVLGCRQSTTLDLGVINIGEEEEDVKLTVSNKEIGINVVETFTLSEDIDDAENTFSNTYTLSIPENNAPKRYPISIRADYNDLKISEQEVVELSGEECEEVLQQKEDEDARQQASQQIEQQSESTETEQEPEITSDITFNPVTTTPTQGFLTKNKFWILVVIAYLAVIVIGIILVSKFLKQ